MCGIRCRYFSKSPPSSCRKDNVVENGAEERKDDNKKKQEAKNKLLNLISELKGRTSLPNKSTDLKIKFAKPGNHSMDLGKQAKENTLLALKLEEQERFSGIDAPLASAVQSVAKSIGGNTRETESDLVQALHSYKSETERAKIDLSDLISSMRVDRSPTEKKKSFEQHRSHSAHRLKDPPSISTQAPYKDDLISSMRVDRSPTEKEKSFEQHRSHSAHRQKDPPSISTQAPYKDRLFGGIPLGIFKKKQHEPEKPTPKTMWDVCEEWELRHLLAPPDNAFEEMIRWTEQGKMWKFPIDNEQGMEKEQNVPFHEHVFLERHLQNGFPQTGPVRHFMELVCVGLSKNPFITVERKLEHIEWYREYFERKAVLQEQEIVVDEHAETG